VLAKRLLGVLLYEGIPGFAGEKIGNKFLIAFSLANCTLGKVYVSFV
jgi:hypothetical protein